MKPVLSGVFCTAALFCLLTSFMVVSNPTAEDNAQYINGSRVVGPALAALLAVFGATTSQLFLVNAVTYLFLVGALLLVAVPDVRPAAGHEVDPEVFVLTDPRGDKPTVYKLDGDKNELNFHVGHTIEARGPLTPPAAGATGANATALTR